MNPSGQKPSSQPMYLPRRSDGMNSETSDWAIGNSAPMPKPSRKRKTTSDSKLHALAHARLARPQTIIEYWNTALRPMRSPSTPAEKAPANMPAKLALASRPAWPLLSPNSSLIGASTKVREARSIESNSHAVAMIAKILF